MNTTKGLGAALLLPVLNCKRWSQTTNPLFSVVSQPMLIKFAGLIGPGEIFPPTKFYQVWLGNSREKWICRLGQATVAPTFLVCGTGVAEMTS